MAAPPYLPRTIEPTLRRAVRQFPVVVLTGPRQAGKTTVLRRLFGSSHRYVSLDDPGARLLAQRDPRLFLEENPPPLFVDEIQYAPNLLPLLKIRVEAERSRKGLFLLTGSQHFALMEGVTESLAGRAAVLTLLPLSWAERARRPDAAPLFAAKVRPRVRGPRSPARELALAWIRGGWPELVASERLESRFWYAGYLQTYLERDVRSLRQVGDLGEFQAFLLAAAARNGQLLNLADLSRDLGVSVNTVKAWVRVLEASGQVFLLRPYYRSLGKRLVKSPKLFFVETGLLCHLLGLRDAEHALDGPAAGALFETAVLGEILRAFTNRGESPRVYFWRTASGEEVDFVVEEDGSLLPIEAKRTKSPREEHARGIERFRAHFAAEALPGRLVCLADEELALTRECRAVPFERFALGA